MAAMSTAAAQDKTGYRVELLVLRHLEGNAEPRSVPDLPDLSNVLDPLSGSGPNDDAAGVTEDPFYLGPPDAELLPPVGPFPDAQGPWSDLVFLEQRSERMNAVWRNLRLSGEFRPEAFLAWEQPAEEPFPELRVHNEEVLLIEDPYAAARATDSPYVFHYDLEHGALRLAPIPEPAYHYVLDGSVRLRRTRFLHFDLDLAFWAGAAGTPAGMAGPPLRADYGGYRAYELRQSRQVRTDRMEYFDSPVLGALLWVTEIEMDNGSDE